MCASSIGAPRVYSREARQATRVLSHGSLQVRSSSSQLVWPQNTPTDLITAGVACGDTVYLLTTPRLSMIQAFALRRPRFLRAIGNSTTPASSLHDALGLAADCVRNILYVVQSTHPVLSFSIPDGKYLRSYSKPAAFVPAPGGHVRLSEDGAELYVSGLWSDEPFGYMKRPRSSMYEKVGWGWRLSLRDDTSRPLFVPFEMGCIAPQAVCLRPLFDRLQGPTPGGWIVAAPGSQHVAVYGKSGSIGTTITVSSSEFRRDGSAIASGDPLEREINWGQTNSVLSHVYAFGDAIAVVHLRQPATDWKRGRVVQFLAYLNLMRTDGILDLTDYPLPGVPIGKDGDSILLLDYGLEGRRADYRDVRLVRLTIGGDAKPRAAPRGGR